MLSRRLYFTSLSHAHTHMYASKVIIEKRKLLTDMNVINIQRM